MAEDPSLLRRQTAHAALQAGVGGVVAGRRALRLLVVVPYRKRGRWLYRRAAYLLTSEFEASAPRLLQMYLDRWQIEVNRREEKDTLGVGQAQVWNEKAVPRQPALMVAAYSALLLAGLEAYGPHRGQAYGELPKWRRKQQRPSCQDLVTLLRQQAYEQPHLLLPFGIRASYQRSALAAAA